MSIYSPTAMETSGGTKQQQSDSCDVLAELFHHIVTNMKAASPLWEDLLNKAGKLQQALRVTATVLAAFIDVMQKIADVATASKGATRDVGSALTRLCLRHRNLETKLRALCTGLADSLVAPLQDRLDDWKKSASAIDKEHTKERKKVRSEIRQLSSEVQSLQNKVRKGKYEAQVQLDITVKDISEKTICLEAVEKRAVTSALVEERSHFCTLVSCLKPLGDTESSMLVDLTSIQEVIESLCLQSADPQNLPASSQQVIDDIQCSQRKWFCQTPPGSHAESRSESPRGSSHKSSLCSINSSSHSSLSSSPGTQSPTRCSLPSPAEHFAALQVPKPATSTISSNDSGFLFHDALFFHPPGSRCRLPSGTSEICSCQIDDKSASPRTASTWTNWPEPKPVTIGAKRSQTSTGQRPNTISSAYERSHTRPAVTSRVFESLGSQRQNDCQQSSSHAHSRGVPNNGRRSTTDGSQAEDDKVFVDNADDEDDDRDDISPLNRAIVVLNNSSAALDNMFTTPAPKANSSTQDDFDEVMRQLELSTASLTCATYDVQQVQPTVTNISSSSTTTAACRHPSTSTARSKPPPPIRRTSSVVSSSSGPMYRDAVGSRSSANLREIQQQTHRKTASEFSANVAPRSSPVECAAPSPVRSGPRRTLSTTHADLIQSLNQQLGGTVAPPTARRPYCRTTSTGDGACSGRALVVSGTATALRRAADSFPSQIRTGALLAEIERGISLRPAVTDDRSGPKLRRQ